MHRRSSSEHSSASLGLPIWNGMRRYGHRELGLLMVSAGFLVGVLTDLIVTYGGA